MVEADYKYKKIILLACGVRKFLPFFMWIKYNIKKNFEFLKVGWKYVRARIKKITNLYQ